MLAYPGTSRYQDCHRNLQKLYDELYPPMSDRQEIPTMYLMKVMCQYLMQNCKPPAQSVLELWSYKVYYSHCSKISGDRPSVVQEN